MRLLEIFKNFRFVKYLSASVGNSWRKLAERSNCSKLKTPETIKIVFNFILSQSYSFIGFFISLLRRDAKYIN